MAYTGQAERIRLRSRVRDSAALVLTAGLLVPALLGLLGFCAVAAAVASVDGVLGITITGLALVLTLLVAAGAAPWGIPWLAAGPLWKPLLLLAGIAVFHLVLFSTVGTHVLLAVPAVPVALAGGGLLLATSLWSQFRHGPAPEPILGRTAADTGRPFTHTLVLVAVNWVSFAAAGMFSAWFLLGR